MIFSKKYLQKSPNNTFEKIESEQITYKSVYITTILDDQHLLDA